MAQVSLDDENVSPYVPCCFDLLVQPEAATLLAIDPRSRVYKHDGSSRLDHSIVV